MSTPAGTCSVVPSSRWRAVPRLSSSRSTRSPLRRRGTPGGPPRTSARSPTWATSTRATTTATGGRWRDERGVAVRDRPVWDDDEGPADDLADAQAVLYVGLAGSGAPALWAAARTRFF